MALFFKIQVAVYVLLVTVSSAAVLRGQPTGKDVSADIATQEAGIQELQKQLDEASADLPKESTKKLESLEAPTKKAVAKIAKPSRPQTEAEKLESLSNGLKTIHNLRFMFANKQKESPMGGAEKFANGAMSEELSNKDSQVWSTIEAMLGSVQKAATSMKGKSKAEQEKVMSSLDGELNKKTHVLSDVTDDVSKKQKNQDEEYLLGLLILHQDNWSMEKQLNATHTFMNNSPVLRSLYEHHDASKPLAPQLAAMMDAESKPLTKKSAVVEKKKGVAKAATNAARALFIQLASTVMNRDCPYCAAQCVDKCHTAGKPYVQCLTDCADAGK